MKDGVSIIVCCYNSAQRIRETLYYVALQEATIAPGWEVIIVNNNSSDETEAVARKACTEFGIKNCTIIREPKAGLINARISGAMNASFNLYSFIDDDNHIEKKWIDKVFSIFQLYADVGACGGSSTAKTDSAAPAWFNAFNSAYAIGKQQEKSGYVNTQRGYLWGAGLSLRKAVWDQLMNSSVSLFLIGRKGKSLLAGEDGEICLRIQLYGWKLWYQEDLRFVHYLPDNRLSTTYLLRIYEGFGKSEVILRMYRSVLGFDPILKFTHEFRSSAKNSVLYTIKSIALKFGSINPVHKLEAQTKMHYFVAYMKTLINIRNEYKKIIKAIEKIKKK